MLISGGQTQMKCAVKGTVLKGMSILVPMCQLAIFHPFAKMRFAPQGN